MPPQLQFNRNYQNFTALANHCIGSSYWLLQSANYDHEFVIIDTSKNKTFPIGIVDSILCMKDNILLSMCYVLIIQYNTTQFKVNNSYATTASIQPQLSKFHCISGQYSTSTINM